MSIDLSGQGRFPSAGAVVINIKEDHPLVQLAGILPWRELLIPVVEDLKETTPKGFWFMGRKIKVRIHLGACLLQQIYNLTDRKIEYQIKDNGAFQLFCGLGIVSGWYAPDHTKIEEFRNRLSPGTKRILACAIARQAVHLGFGDPRDVDFDSTVQEANITYPSDANLMTKLTAIGKKIMDFLRKNRSHLLPEDGLSVDLRAVKKKAREYFFLPKNKAIEVKRQVFKKLHRLVKKQMRPVVDFCEALTNSQIENLPWNIRRACEQVRHECWRYLLDVGHFTRTHCIKTGKILSFHARSVACIKKGKLGKEFEFGRVFQLGRIKGNFLFVIESTSVGMNDKVSFIPLIEEHSRLFGEGVLETVAADKGYWSAKNRKKLMNLAVSVQGLQKPSNVKSTEKDMELQERLQNRRAGIEPLIGHAKHGGQLGKSRMKSDRATLAAGYGSILGLNLRQMIRHQQGKAVVAA